MRWLFWQINIHKLLIFICAKLAPSDNTRYLRHINHTAPSVQCFPNRFIISYDLAVQTGGETLPVTFKFGSDEQPEYHTFDNLDELKDFYTKAVRYIQKALAEGWKKKDKFKLDLYRIE